MDYNFYNLELPNELCCSVQSPISLVWPIELVPNANTKIHYDNKGSIDYIEFYNSYDGTIEKIVDYQGPFIKRINFYQNNRLYKAEEYSDSKICTREYYNNGIKVETNSFQYNNDNRLIKINKTKNNVDYYIQYEYDCLSRIKTRRAYANCDKLIEQKYKFDILDRVIEYEDDYQKIVVNNFGEHNELLSYTITDMQNNVLNIQNQFYANKYLHSVLTLNSSSLKVQNKHYVDNILLKKPIPSETDFNFILLLFTNSRNANIPSLCNIHSQNQKTNKCFNDNIKAMTVVPISMRKYLLYETRKLQNA